MSEHEFINSDIYEEIAQLRKSSSEVVLVTVVAVQGSTPRREGAKMLVFPDGKISGTVGGGIREADIIAEALKLFKEGETRMMEVDFTEGLTTGRGPVCGGKMTVFMERIGRQRRAVISGAGHIGWYLHRMFKLLEFKTMIIDPRPEFNSAERFPGAHLARREFAEGIEGLVIGAQDAVILVGPGHEKDREMLPSVLRSSAGYIGMIGSKRKKTEVFQGMKNLGFTDTDLARIHSPIGLAIASESPAEIAVSIVAEVIKHFKCQQ